MDEWVNKDYLGKDVMKEIKASFKAQKPLQSIQLQQFIHPRKFKPLQQALQQARAKHDGIPDMYSYHVLHSTDPVIKDFMEFWKKEFSQLVYAYTGVNISGPAEIAAFKHRDYTVLHDKMPQSKALMIGYDVFDFDVGYGGYTSFVKNGQELTRVIGTENALNIVAKPANVYYFTRYVNHWAGKYRRVVIGSQQKL